MGLWRWTAVWRGRRRAKRLIRAHAVCHARMDMLCATIDSHGEEIVAMQRTLGLMPQGGAETVAQRLDEHSNRLATVEARVRLGRLQRRVLDPRRPHG